MKRSKYNEIISNPKFNLECDERMQAFENMQSNSYRFNLEAINWWKNIFEEIPDVNGYFDVRLNKFTSCFESPQYRYAFCYKDGHLNLIIENTNLDE